jgi:hypothetical protein
MTAMVTSTWFRNLATLLVMTMTCISVVPRAQAGFVPSDSGTVQTERSQDMATVQKVLENKKVRQRLQDLGYAPAEIEARLAALSDAELHRLSTQMESLTAGGNGVGLVIGVLLVILLVILILELTGNHVIIT